MVNKKIAHETKEPQSVGRKRLESAGISSTITARFGPRLVAAIEAEAKRLRCSRGHALRAIVAYWLGD